MEIKLKKISFLTIFLFMILLWVMASSVNSETLLFIDDMNYSTQGQAEAGGWVFGGTSSNKYFNFNGTTINIGATGTISGNDAYGELNIQNKLGFEIENNTKIVIRGIWEYPEQTRYSYYDTSFTNLVNFLFTTANNNMTIGPQNDTSYTPSPASVGINVGAYNIIELEFKNNPRHRYNLTVNDVYIGEFDYYSARNFNFLSLTSQGGGGDIWVDWLKIYNTTFIPPTLPSNFSIDVFSDYNGDVVNNVSVNISGVGVFSNTTGNTIITGLLQNDTSFYNLTVFSNGWFSNDYVNVNVTSNLGAVLNQTNVTVNFLFSNGDFANFGPINFTDLDNGLFFNVTGGNISFSPNGVNTTFRVSCDNEVFAPFNYTFDFVPLDNRTFNLTVNETQNVLTFLDANNSNPINNATIGITYPSGYVLNLTTNSSGDVSFSYILNNVIEFGNYSFQINKLGYINLSFNEVINSSNVPFSKTYNVSRAKLIINIFNRDGGALLSGVNVSIAFVGLFNETTTTGNLTKDNLSIVSGDYIIYASSIGFKTETRTFTFTNQEELTINFYLLNLSNVNIGNLFVTTTDSFFRKIADAKCELLEYVPNDLSFVSVSECVTNINAECSFNIELNIKTYYLRCTSVIDGNFLVAETSQDGEIITTTNEIRNLIFYTRDEFIISPVDNLIYTITESFLNNVSQISVNFNSYDGSAIEVCIEYFIREGTTFTSVTGDTYCLISSSAIQNIGTSVTLNRSNNYEARVYIKQTNENINLKTFVYPNSSSFGEVFDNDFISAFIMILWVFALAFCLHSKNMTLWFYLAIILSWVEVIIFPTFTIVSISVFKTIISGLTIMIARKKKDLT